MRKVAFAAVAFALLQTPASADTDFCVHLNSFIRAPFPTPSGGKPVARSIEFFWLPGDLLPNVQCQHDGIREGAKFCGWLIENTSREFSEMLPESVLKCEGFGFPPVPNVEDWKATYSIVDDVSLRWMILEVRRGQENTRYDAIRVSVLPDGQDSAMNPLPAFPEPERTDASLPNNN
jgi:hypothetical protein